MLPPPGLYRITRTTPPAGSTADVRVTLTGLQTAIGDFTYSPPVDLFVAGPPHEDLAIECLGNGQYLVVNGPNNIQGTCERIGP